jgi:hypothetical protein
MKTRDQAKDLTHNKRDETVKALDAGLAALARAATSS